MKKILFICLGNICRSPMAEYLCRHMAAQRGIAVQTASAGTSGWHDGEGMHCGTADVLDGLGIASQDFISRKIKKSDANDYDYLIVMDDSNLRDVENFSAGSLKKSSKSPTFCPKVVATTMCPTRGTQVISTKRAVFLPPAAMCCSRGCNRAKCSGKWAQSSGLWRKAERYPA